MSHPTCCCSSNVVDRCVCVSLEGFHLVGVARTPDALVHDIVPVIALLGALGERLIRGATMQDWLDNGQPRGVPCGPTSSHYCKPHRPARFAGVQVLGSW